MVGVVQSIQELVNPDQGRVLRNSPVDLALPEVWVDFVVLHPIAEHCAVHTVYGHFDRYLWCRDQILNSKYVIPQLVLNDIAPKSPCSKVDRKVLCAKFTSSFVIPVPSDEQVEAEYNVTLVQGSQEVAPPAHKRRRIEDSSAADEKASNVGDHRHATNVSSYHDIPMDMNMNSVYQSNSNVISADHRHVINDDVDDVDDCDRDVPMNLNSDLNPNSVVVVSSHDRRSNDDDVDDDVDHI